MKAAHQNRLVRMIRSAQVVFRKGGLRSSWEALRAFLFCRQRVDVFAIELSQGYSPPPLDPRVEIRQAKTEDLALLRSMPEGNRSEFYRDQVDGAEPWVALWQGRPAHIAWVYDSVVPTRFIPLKPGEAELKFGYTCTEFRGRGLYGATNAVIAAELSRRGYQRVYGVMMDHGPAFRIGLELSLRRTGFRRLSTVTHLRLLGVQLRPRLSL